MSELKDCPTCGYKTTRDFCTPECRMRDSDNRIESIQEERDRYKKDLRNIIHHLNNQWPSAIRSIKEIGINLEEYRK